MSEPNSKVVNLVSAQVPADQGLSSLGLIMQLGGSLFAAYAALMTFVVVFAMRGGQATLTSLLVLALCVVRSLFHRAAGTELLYGRRTYTGEIDNADPLAGIRRYIAIAGAQTIVLALVLFAKLQLPVALVAGIAGGLLVWPVTLTVLFQLPRLSRFKQHIPVSEDKGFEGASILMTVFGLCGVFATGSVLVLIFQVSGRTLTQGPGVLLILSLAMLVIRGVIHLQAGMSGLRETSVDRSVELANRYANFGVISTFCAGGALLMLFMTARFDLAGLVLVAGACWMLMAWPLIIRRFFSDRQFADLLAGDHASLHRRSPDAGLAGLGWLLVALAAFSASLLVPQLLSGSSNRVADLLAMTALGGHSLWWSVGIVVLQGWAGYELIRMGPHHRIIGSVYALVSGGLGLYLLWPALELLRHSGDMFGGPEKILTFGPMALQLVIPIATLILLNRSIAPTARARVRSRS